jgi:hypothetical protein
MRALGRESAYSLVDRGRVGDQRRSRRPAGVPGRVAERWADRQRPGITAVWTIDQPDPYDLEPT